MMNATEKGKKFKGIKSICGNIFIFLIMIFLMMLLLQTREVYANGKKVSGTLKALTELSRDFIKTTTLKPSYPVGELINIFGVYGSDDPEWNNATYYSVWINENLNFTGHSIITLQGGDQIFCKVKSKVKEVGLHDWSADNKGWFIGGTGKFKGIKGRWREKIVYVMSKFTIEWEAEYEIK
jgi:hypothetical protein